MAFKPVYPIEFVHPNGDGIMIEPEVEDTEVSEDEDWANSPSSLYEEYYD